MTIQSRWRSRTRRTSTRLGRADSTHPFLEDLEARRLLAVAINEFGGSGTVTSPAGITAGPDDALWFTEPAADQIGRISTSGTITEYSTGISPNADPYDITLGPVPANGGSPNLWFTEPGVDQIGEITPQGVVNEFGGLSEGLIPEAITLGPDGNLWFTEDLANGDENPDISIAIGTITPTGTVTQFSLDLTSHYALNDIVTGPDNALWFTMTTPTGGDIGRITTTGNFTLYPITNNTALDYSSSPMGIVAGANNDLWFADQGNHAIGEITTAGRMTEFTQGLTFSDLPSGITAGPDGNDWFTDPGDTVDQVGRITPQGVITFYPTPTNPADPLGITSGPDNNLWFTESSANQIGQVVLAQGITNAKGTGATVVAGLSSSFQVATFDDNSTATSAANFSATIDYGDGSTGSGTILPLASPAGAYEVIGTHTYAKAGSFIPVVTISTATASIAPVSGSVVAQFPLSSTGDLIDGLAGRRSNTHVADFGDLNPNDTPADFTVTVNWADGSVSTGSATDTTSNSQNNEFFGAFAGHDFASPGTYTNNVVTITDILNGFSTTASFTATITAPPSFTPINEVGPDSLTPGAGATDIVLGPDGALWFTETALAGSAGSTRPAM